MTRVPSSGTDGRASDALLALGKFFTRWEESDDGRAAFRKGSPVMRIRDEVLEEARAAGATIGRPGAATFWGGYSGVFVDPDGHPWEVAHNPFWAIGRDGGVTI